MADTFRFDLAALESIPEKPLDALSHRIDGCIPQVTISSEVEAAIRARYRCGVYGIIGPRDPRTALLTVERDGDRVVGHSDHPSVKG